MPHIREGVGGGQRLLPSFVERFVVCLNSPSCGSRNAGREERRTLHTTCASSDTPSPKVADVRYVATGEGCFRSGDVLDAWSRRIVGWAMGETLWSELVVEALNMAVWYGRPAMRVAHHSIEVIPASTFSRRREERAWFRRWR